VGTITVLFTPLHLRVRRTIRFFGPLGISLGKRHCSLDRHGVDEWIAARAPNFAENEERPIGLDLDADFRIFNVGVPQFCGDVVGELEGREPSRSDRADQGQRDEARSHRLCSLRQQHQQQHARDSNFVAHLHGFLLSRYG
jgi:hypothetical protein